jgi:exopolyphosphatase / guanosine-5'-triphosphate,3'-diphosphate pyrophosphatase
VAAKVKNVIATSGTAAALGHRGQPSAQEWHRQRMLVSRAEMTRLAKRLARLPVDDRRKIEGIGLRRAEIVVAGAMVYHEVARALPSQGISLFPARLARRLAGADGGRT